MFLNTVFTDVVDGALVARKIGNHHKPSGYIQRIKDDYGISEAGALNANYIVLRLPLNVRSVFLEWLERTQPIHKDRVLSRIRSARDGELSDSRYGRRMRGEGEMAEQIGRTFKAFAKKYGLDRKLPPLDFSAFRPPRASSGQMNLF